MSELICPGGVQLSLEPAILPSSASAVSGTGAGFQEPLARSGSVLPDGDGAGAHATGPPRRGRQHGGGLGQEEAAGRGPRRARPGAKEAGCPRDRHDRPRRDAARGQGLVDLVLTLLLATEEAASHGRLALTWSTAGSARRRGRRRSSGAPLRYPRLLRARRPEPPGPGLPRQQEPGRPGPPRRPAQARRPARQVQRTPTTRAQARPARGGPPGS